MSKPGSVRPSFPSIHASQRRPHRRSSTSPAARSTSSPASCSSPLLSDVAVPGLHPREPGTGSLDYVFRLTFGLGMASSLVLGVVAIRRRDLEAHRAWMMRAYALATGAGTQVFTQGFAEGVVGDGELSSAMVRS